MSVASPARLVGFRVAGVRAALPFEVVRQIAERPPLVRIPGCHPFVAGVALHEGVAIPVYDLRRLEGLWADEPPPLLSGHGEATQIIVCDWGDTLLGILGDGVDVLSDADGATHDRDGAPRPSVLNGAYLQGLLPPDGEPLALLDPDRLFASLGIPASGSHGRRVTGEDDPARG